MKMADCAFKIKEARINRHISQAKLASLIGVNYSVISRYESGAIIPPPERLKQIAEVLNIPVSELYDDGEQSSPIRGKSPSSSLQKPEEYIFGIDYFGELCNFEDKSITCNLCGNPAQHIDKVGNLLLDNHTVCWLERGGSVIGCASVITCHSCHVKAFKSHDPDMFNKIVDIAKEIILKSHK